MEPESNRVQQSNNTTERPDDEIKRALEAILFASGEPVGYERLATVFSTTASRIKRLAAEFAREFDERGIRLLCFDTACQLCTCELYENEIKDALGIKKNGALSNSSLEVLAIIPYNQPVTRAYVEQVRGVDSSYAIGVLSARSLIETKGKLDVPGRPNLYVTTKNFLRVFGISSIDELPSIDLLSSPTAEENPPDEATNEQKL